VLHRGVGKVGIVTGPGRVVCERLHVLDLHFGPGVRVQQQPTPGTDGADCIAGSQCPHPSGADAVTVQKYVELYHVVRLCGDGVATTDVAAATRATIRVRSRAGCQLVVSIPAPDKVIRSFRGRGQKHLHHGEVKPFRALRLHQQRLVVEITGWPARDGVGEHPQTWVHADHRRGLMCASTMSTVRRKLVSPNNNKCYA